MSCENGMILGMIIDSSLHDGSSSLWEPSRVDPKVANEILILAQMGRVVVTTVVSAKRNQKKCHLEGYMTV